MPPPAGPKDSRHEPLRTAIPSAGPEAAGTEVRWIVTEDMAAVCGLPIWTAVGNLSGPAAALPPAATPARRVAPATPGPPHHPSTPTPPRPRAPPGAQP